MVFHIIVFVLLETHSILTGFHDLVIIDLPVGQLTPRSSVLFYSSNSSFVPLVSFPLQFFPNILRCKPAVPKIWRGIITPIQLLLFFDHSTICLPSPYFPSSLSLSNYLPDADLLV